MESVNGVVQPVLSLELGSRVSCSDWSLGLLFCGRLTLGVFVVLVCWYWCFAGGSRCFSLELRMSVCDGLTHGVWGAGFVGLGAVTEVLGFQSGVLGLSVCARLTHGVCGAGLLILVF